MKRTIFTTLAVTAFLTIPACKGGGSAQQGGKLIPEQATVMLGVDVAGLMKSKLYTDNKAKFESAPGYKDMAEAAKGCSLDVEKAVSSVLVGTDMKEFAAVVSGEGLGDEKNLTCIADKGKEKNGGKPLFTIVDEGGKKTLKMDKGTGYIVDARTIVVASAAWAGAVKDLMDGKGKAAVDGANSGLFGRADQSRHIWAAGKLPAGMGMIPLVGEVKDFSGSLDMSDGAAIQATIGFEKAEQATMIKALADSQIPKAKESLAGQGLPATIADTLKIDAKDNLLSVELKLSDSDLKTLQDKAAGMAGALSMFGGGGGGAMPAEPAMPPPSTPPPAEGAPAPAE